VWASPSHLAQSGVATKKEVALEKALNAKNKVLHLKNELHQVQTQVQHDDPSIKVSQIQLHRNAKLVGEVPC
jgi:predicted GTPase